MKTILGFFALLSLCLLAACVSVKDELFLQNIQIEGSPSQPPVHITGGDRKAKSLYAAPYLPRFRNRDNLPRAAI